MMDTADKISRFFNNSPKRQLALEGWMERHEAFQVFNDLFFPIFYCLEAISHSAATDWNRETRSDPSFWLYLNFRSLLHWCLHKKS